MHSHLLHSWNMYFCLAIIIINMGDLRKANGANKVLPLSLALSPSAGAGGGHIVYIHFPKLCPFPAGWRYLQRYVHMYVRTGCVMVADQR